ncbi:MAG: hypothetical protein K1Y36_21670 [Blastocatellia bacterium]|nr:hypothetical protein [Blastocatellia bacterium]
MSFHSGTIRALQQLLSVGETEETALQPLQAGRELGLWTVSADGKRAVATETLVELWERLPSDAETVAAVFACDPTVREKWFQIIAARLNELGQGRDAESLCRAVSTLSAAATAVEANLPHSRLEPTGFQEIEAELLGATAEQAICTPKLLRVLGDTSRLVEAGKGKPGRALPDVDALNPSQNWISGRLLRLPKAEDVSRTAPSSALSGGWAGDSTNAMQWVLGCPWAFLLAQVAFTQEAWAAERISGRLALEIDRVHVAMVHQPPRVEIAVTSATGEEVGCGSLGELLVRLCRRLGIVILGRNVTGAVLDARLAPLIEQLQRSKVWRFDPGGGLRQPGYVIHERFSDQCYQITGSKYFYRLGERVTAEIRACCDAWAKERLVTTAVSVGL